MLFYALRRFVMEELEETEVKDLKAPRMARIRQRALPPVAIALVFLIGSVFFHEHLGVVVFCALLTGLLFIIALRYPPEDLDSRTDTLTPLPGAFSFYTNYKKRAPRNAGP